MINQGFIRFICTCTMICLTSSAFAKSPLWSIASDDAQKHVFFTQQCISFGHQEGTRSFDQCVKKLSAMEKAQGFQDGENERGFPQLRYRGF